MKYILSLLVTVLCVVTGYSQFTELKSNSSLESGFLLNNTQSIFISSVDSTLWATDNTPNGTVQLSTLRLVNTGGVINGKFIFSAISPEYGTELFVTDGSPSGTLMLKDIFPGITGSMPDADMALLNGAVYFTAASPSIGRELWKTDGTAAGTVLVKDIIQGTTGANIANGFNLFSNGSYLLFNARTTFSGSELWFSDGTEAGTRLVKDINPGAASSDADKFYSFNNQVLFTAKDALHGTELWATDGTATGTYLVKDINAGIANSNITGLFFGFNGKLFFSANNGTTGDELWSTDGTEANTTLLKDIQPGLFSSFATVTTAVKLNGRFIFQAYNTDKGFELWQSDGTPAGTQLLKDIVPGAGSSDPFIFPASFNINGGYQQPLFQTNKFFFMATTPANGTELWISDGTDAGTQIVKDINPGVADGIEHVSYLYTTAGLYFCANNRTKGNEIWKSDGTASGTTLVADINPGAGSSTAIFSHILNSRILFSATNGDQTTRTDLYRLDLFVAALPLRLIEFTGIANNNDAVLNWSTAEEMNISQFTIEKSFDGVHFTTAGTVAASGSSMVQKKYQFTDVSAGSGDRQVFYRLAIVEQDGKVSYSKVVVIGFQLRGLTMKILSNPINSELTLLLSGNNNNTKLIITDMNGRTVLTTATRFNGVVKIPAQHLNSGVYVLTATNSQGKQSTRFVK